MRAENFQLMAKYNRWMNGKLLSSAAELSAKELSKNMGAYFGSILGTLNHLLVADIIWLKRFASHPAQFSSLDPLSTFASPVTLDQQLYDNLQHLQTAREKLDDIIVDFSTELSEEALGTEFEYRNMKGEVFRNRLAFPLQHFFNHQTHHRGQITTLLNQSGKDVGITDLLVTIRDLQLD